MPGPPETAWLTDDALLWRAAGYDYHNTPRTDENGEVLRVAGPPIVIKCRWENTFSPAPSEPGRDRYGGDHVANIAVAIDIPRGSILWLGKEEDWYGTGSGGVDNELVIVDRIRTSKDLKGNVTRRLLVANKFRNTLPNEA